MDLQFNQSVVKYLQSVAREYQTQEQTLEIRIPDGMPDIGVVLACWGQPVLRGKEWRGEHVGITGGVMAKILYLPEEAGAPQVVEAWLPFQMKWMLPNGKQDGTMTVDLGLRSADARVLTARKLMVRTNVGALMQAVVPADFTLCSAADVPEDVQLLTNRYFLTLPKEAGEKAFGLDELLEFPASEQKPDQVVHCSVSPQVLEQKVLSNKLIFRGICIVHLLFRGVDGQLYSRDFDVPFSQYADLDTEFDAEATMRIVPVVTNLELEQGAEGQLRLKAGLSGQYMVYDRVAAEIVEDAYSTVRTVDTALSQLKAPSVLWQTSESVNAKEDPQVDVMRPVDVVFWPEQPYLSRDGEQMEADLGGIFQMLYYDPEGQLQCVQTRWQETQMLPVDADSGIAADVGCNGKAQYAAGVLYADILLHTAVTDRQGMDMVCGLELGDPMPLPQDRPSLIVTKCGNDTLWQIAKANATTIEKIRQANGLSDDPAPDSVLLIPIA